MEKHDSKFSIVIVAGAHNPSILNPDFLLRNEIVPNDWLIDQKHPILTTPGISQFRFLSGISFLLDPEKLIIEDIVPEGEIFPVPDIAIEYIKKVPHVNYGALGINFDKALIFNSLNQAHNFQKNTFLKEGPWNENGNLSEFVAKFIYKFPKYQCNLSFSSPVIFPPAPTRKKELYGLILSANFHRDFNKIDDHKKRNAAIIKAISNWENDKELFESLTHKLTGGS